MKIHEHALRINAWAIFALAAAIETSICVWTFLILPLIPLGYPKSMAVIQFISSGVLQLVALPILAVASKRSGQAIEALIHETHDAVMEMHNKSLDLHEQTAADIACLHGKIDELSA